MKTIMPSASIAIAVLACTSEQIQTEPSTNPTSARTAVHPYTAVDLGTIGGNTSDAYAINAAGQIVGTSAIAPGSPTIHAYLWNKGVMTDLGTLGGTSSVGWGINARGQVIGSSSNAAGLTRAFLWENGVMTDLGSLDDRYSFANAINARSQIVGTTSVPAGELHAFLWKKGRMTDLGTLGNDATSTANDINSAGTVVGVSGAPRPSFEGHPVLWEKDGTIVSLKSLDVTARPNAINPAGVIVGTRNFPSGLEDAFVLVGGVITDLGASPTLASGAADINPAGDIVGYQQVGQYPHAVLWTRK